MAELTKEWLQQTIAELEEERDAVPGAVNEDAANALAAMNLALASIEAEPVSDQDERYQHLSEIYHAQEKRLFKLAQRIKGESFDKYSHSPSQAIDVLESAIFGESAEEDSHSAMLQGAESNSPVNPDGVCPSCGRKQLKNRTCSVSGCDGKHIARGFCIKHYAIERKKDPSRRESIRAADKRYRARKAAAPQQEVK